MHIPLGVDTVVVHIKFNSVVSKEAYKKVPLLIEFLVGITLKIFN